MIAASPRTTSGRTAVAVGQVAGSGRTALVRCLLPALVLSHLWVGLAIAETVEQGEALAWLQRIAQAARELNYRGTFVYQHGEQAETSRITHFVDRTGEYEKLETLDGPRREIFRNNTEILTFYADSRVVKRERRTARKAFPALLPDQLSVLTEFYQLRRGGQERIGGFDSQALILEPRDEYRYGHKLWAEVNTGLLLKARMFNEHNQVIEQFHFTELTINPPLTREAVRPAFAVPPAERRDAADAPAGPVDTGWVVRNQPAGFKKIMEMKRFKQSGNEQVAHLVFSDGLAAVSVFIEPLPSIRKVPEGLSHQGAVNIYTRAMSDQLVTVLGETPPVTIMQIANSIGAKGR
jgi:sigma-E factor negative regulatory protein RseB